MIFEIVGKEHKRRKFMSSACGIVSICDWFHWLHSSILGIFWSKYFEQQVLMCFELVYIKSSNMSSLRTMTSECRDKFVSNVIFPPSNIMLSNNQWQSRICMTNSTSIVWKLFMINRHDGILLRSRLPKVKLYIGTELPRFFKMNSILRIFQKWYKQMHGFLAIV